MSTAAATCGCRGACPACRSRNAAAGEFVDEFGRVRRFVRRVLPRRPACPPGLFRGPFGTCLRFPLRLPAPLPDPFEPTPSPTPAPMPSPAPTPTPAPQQQACGPIRYRVDPQRPFGPKWKLQRPPGLPAAARQTSATGEARPHIQCVAAAQGLGAAFVNGILSLADNETGGTFCFALPANIFNALPEAERGGRPLITAWGVFQFNNPAWRRDVGRVLGRPHTTPVWDCTPLEELEYPIRFYALIYREIIAAGGQPVDAVRGMRLQHHGPGVYRPFLQAGRAAGFAAAWQRVPEDHRGKIQRSLTKWGFPAA